MKTLATTDNPIHEPDRDEMHAPPTQTICSCAVWSLYFFLFFFQVDEHDSYRFGPSAAGPHPVTSLVCLGWSSLPLFLVTDSLTITRVNAHTLNRLLASVNAPTMSKGWPEDIFLVDPIEPCPPIFLLFRGPRISHNFLPWIKWGETCTLFYLSLDYASILESPDVNHTNSNGSTRTPPQVARGVFKSLCLWSRKPTLILCPEWSVSIPVRQQYLLLFWHSIFPVVGSHFGSHPTTIVH